MNHNNEGQFTVAAVTDETLCLRDESAEAIAKVRCALAQIRELLDPQAASEAALLENEIRYETELTDFSQSAERNMAAKAP